VKRSGLVFVVLLIVLTARGVSAATGDVAAGAELFESVCQSCHGENGAGDGPGAAEFVLQPRPFYQAAFKFDNDSDWEKGSDVDLANVIREGAALYGGSSMMPPWPALTNQNVEDLVAYIRSVGPPRVSGLQAAPASYDFVAVYDLLVTHCGACHVQGIADGPWSLDTPPTSERFAQCLPLDPDEQLRCATYHQLVDIPAPGIPAWIRPEQAPLSEPYAQACDSTTSFHIGHSIPESLSDRDCAGFLGWIEAGAADPAGWRD
jgi:mono/diheme cytochrome c family protein